MLGFGRAAVPRRATLQTSDQIVIQITHMQVPSHPALHEIIDLNDLRWRHAGQDALRRRKIALAVLPRTAFAATGESDAMAGFAEWGCSSLGAHLSLVFRFLLCKPVQPRYQGAEFVETALAHAVGDQVERAYKRSDLIE